jgi:hypothetical protein
VPVPPLALVVAVPVFTVHPVEVELALAVMADGSVMATLCVATQPAASVIVQV